MPPSAVALYHVTRRFGATLAVDDISLDVPAGEFVTLLGPSGCGKTTTLRMIAGFEQPDAGEITVCGVAMGARPPHQRPTAMVFQNYALFPHMSVAENIAFGLRERRVGREEQRRRVGEMLALVELEGYGDRRPRELSGGQQQRVALARALVVEPAVLLLDEPLGALDLRLRRAMQRQLAEIQHRIGITFIYVTHDQEEALTMADRIVIMHAGRIVEAGSAMEVYDRPRTRFAAEFMGAENLIEARVEAADSTSTRVCVGPNALNVAIPAQGETATLMIRPEHIRLTDDPDGWSATVVSRVWQGAQWALGVELADGTPLAVAVPRDASPPPDVGGYTRIAIGPEHVWVIPDVAADRHALMERAAR